MRKHHETPTSHPVISELAVGVQREPCYTRVSRCFPPTPCCPPQAGLVCRGRCHPTIVERLRVLGDGLWSQTAAKQPKSRSPKEAPNSGSLWSIRLIRRKQCCVAVAYLGRAVRLVALWPPGKKVARSRRIGPRFVNSRRFQVLQISVISRGRNQCLSRTISVL